MSQRMLRSPVVHGPHIGVRDGPGIRRRPYVSLYRASSPVSHDGHPQVGRAGVLRRQRLRQRVGNQGIQRLMAERAESGRSSGARAASLPSDPNETHRQRGGDAHEREADHVADVVMRMPANQVQWMCADCEGEQKDNAVPRYRGRSMVVLQHLWHHPLPRTFNPCAAAAAHSLPRRARSSSRGLARISATCESTLTRELRTRLLRSGRRRSRMGTTSFLAPAVTRLNRTRDEDSWRTS